MFISLFQKAKEMSLSFCQARFMSTKLKCTVTYILRQCHQVAPENVLQGGESIAPDTTNRLKEKIPSLGKQICNSQIDKWMTEATLYVHVCIAP